MITLACSVGRRTTTVRPAPGPAVTAVPRRRRAGPPVAPLALPGGTRTPPRPPSAGSGCHRGAEPPIGRRCAVVALQRGAVELSLEQCAERGVVDRPGGGGHRRGGGG